MIQFDALGLISCGMMMRGCFSLLNHEACILFARCASFANAVALSSVSVILGLLCNVALSSVSAILGLLCNISMCGIENMFCTC